MREILFKAKRLDNDNWVLGSLLSEKEGRAFIVPSGTAMGLFKHGSASVESVVEVRMETICQYTGLTDKNDTKIFENDIAKLNIEYVGGAIREYICRVCFDEYGVAFEDVKNKNIVIAYDGDVGKNDIDIIGNNFDNSELLKTED